MGHPLQSRDLKGATDLAGKYRLIAELGQGGMATVYLAVALGNSGFRKLAVVKVLRPEFAVDDEFIQMFLDEARLCARLSHPNIVHTYDVGVDESGHLIAMEYLDGVSLHAATAKLGRNAGSFTFPLQAKALLEVVEGLRYAHELTDYDGRSLEIVHRDVTPHNIFVTYDGQVKLLDFGIAKAATSSVKTATGVIKGKLTYMAPEQARGDPVDARADLYAVGVMLWEAVTGRRRWPTGLTEPALFTRLATGELPEPPGAAARGFPAEVDDIVMRALAPSPADRYQTAAELRDALDGVLRQIEPVSLRDLGGMLSKTFEVDRKRIRIVIEEQFRAIESGGDAAAPHQLPAVPHPSFITTSENMERQSPQPGSSRSMMESLTLDPLVESQSRRITAPAPDPVAPTRSRINGLFIGAGVLAAAAFILGVAVPRARSVVTPSPAPTASVEVAPVRPPATQNPSAIERPHEVGQGEGSPAPSSSETAAAASAHRWEGAGRHGPPPVLLHEAAHPAGSAAVVTPPPASAAPTDTAPGEMVPIRVPQTRPKVQLERDNPWP